MLKRRRVLADITQDEFDLADIENSVIQEIDILDNAADLSIYDCKIIVCFNTTRDINQIHNLNNFSFKQTECVLILIDAAHEKHFCSSVNIIFKIRTTKLKLSLNLSFKYKASEADKFSLSLFFSHQLLKKSDWTSKLKEQQTMYFNWIVMTEDFKRQLADKWIYRSKNCTNQDSYCYSDLQNSHAHYSVSFAQQKSWVTAISAEKCTLLQFLIKILLFWKEQESSVTQNFRVLSYKSFQQIIKSSFKSIKSFLKTLKKQIEHIRV